MIRRLLAAALLALVMVSYASADYLLIVVNLNAKPPAPDDGMGGDGMNPMQPPMGGPKGGPMPPMGGGGKGGPMMPMPGGGYSPNDEADDVPDLIVAVVEVKSLTPQAAKLFGDGKSLVKFKHAWGTIDLQNKTWLYEAALLEKQRGSPLHTVRERFAAEKKAILGASQKPSTHEAVKKVALFALELGLVDECAKVLDELAQSDKNNASVKAYLTVKEELDKPLNKQDQDAATKWKDKLLDGYKVSQLDKHHFALIHSGTLGADEVKPHLEQLERSFRAYYYWWACKGIALHVAKDPQVAVLAEAPKEFADLKSNLTPSPVLADSFFARRESLSVFSHRRSDLHYSKMTERWKKMEDDGFVRHEIISGVAGKGVPTKTKEGQALPIQLRELAAKEPRIYALMLKSMENEWQQTSLTHQASRQMLFASKQLPRNVQAPEWIQFGMGAFFETPLQAPWPSIGAANPYWLPRFRETYKSKKYETSNEALLKKVVTDAYFREKPKGEKEEAAKSREANLRRARAASWALTFYLARAEEGDNPKYLAKLQRYYKELAKLPRDTALDEKVLWACFTKAFELNTPEKIRTFATGWIRYVEDAPLEAKGIHEKISEIHKKMTTPPPEKKGGNTGGGNNPMLPKMP